MVNKNNTQETRKKDVAITVKSDDNNGRENAQKQWLVVSDEGGGGSEIQVRVRMNNYGEKEDDQ